MKVSYKWLQTYFDEKLPKPDDLADLILLHSYEVEDLAVNPNDSDDYIINIDILPNRAHDSLCHYGIAREISTITNLKMNEPEILPNSSELESNFSVHVSDSAEKFCKRYIGCVIENINVTDSPKELREKIESIGEKSINNIVDITNIVMFELGQPMHAFDFDKIDGDKIYVRSAFSKENLITLDNKNVELNENNFVIADEKNALAIAGVKGGKKAEVNNQTKNIILESANFSPVLVRKTSRGLNILTESSKRFENEITPWLCERAMNMALDLIKKYASTSEIKIYKNFDYYPKPVNQYKTGVSLSEINKILGTNYSKTNIENALNSLNFNYEIVNPREKILELAPKYLNVPYKWGASVLNDAPKYFDCSSYVSYLYKEAGVSISRDSIDQFFYGQEISKQEAGPGDLVFGNSHEGSIRYESTNFLKGSKFEKGIDHVGIYLGDDLVIHSSRHGLNSVQQGIITEHDAFKEIVAYCRILDSEEDRFVVTVPETRLDIRDHIDLTEEIGRILGYENIKDQEINIENFNPQINKDHYFNKILTKIFLDNGFSQVITYSFIEKGEIAVKNPIAKDKQFLRNSLEWGIKDSLQKNINNADWLELDQIKIFEIGKVFKKEGEKLMLGIGIKNKSGFKKVKTHEILSQITSLISSELNTDLNIKISNNQEFLEIDLDNLYQNLTIGTENNADQDKDNINTHYIKLNFEQKESFKNLSPYPFVTRDLAIWLEKQEQNDILLNIIKEKGGNLLIKEPKLFDNFNKDGRTSYAYRLIFQSFEKTLTDEEVNSIMQEIYQEIKNNIDGSEIR
jgi:phenylalanyl-tRNA synthetase beta subunit